jgi:hypothetical protein
MAVTQSDIDNLNAAIASGARSATVGGQTLTYNTTASLIQARNDLQRQLDAQGGPRRRRQTYLYQSGRGND